MTTTLNADDGVVSGSAGLKYSADSSGVLALQTNGTTAVSVSTAQVVTLTNALAEASGGIGTTVGYNGFKNRIINGGMVVNQRGGTVTPGAGGTYGIDRFYGYASGGGVFTAVQSTDTPSGSGFSYSNLLTVTTPDSSIGATEYYSTGQFIEGYNVADLMWGTANAKTVTLSFWVKSSVTGSYSACLYNNAGDRCYPAAFTISAANTWQQVTLTVAGDTSGTWLTTNGIGLALRIDLGSGASFNGTANTWNTSGGFVGIRTSSNVDWIATNGATFYYTGVQLEKGSTATSFDYRPYGTELALCQRYYQRISDSVNTNVFVATGLAYTATRFFTSTYFKVQMRIPPQAVDFSNLRIQNVGSAYTVTAVTAIANSTTAIGATEMNVASGLTANGYYYVDTSSTSGYLGFTAEL
jgi:hypothetical protein